MRWMSWAVGLTLLLAVAGGCKQRCFVTAADYADMQNRLPPNLEHDPNVMAQPTIPPSPPPPNVYDLSRKVRYLSVAEAISIALERGTVGQPSLLFPGIALDNLLQFTGNGTGGSDNIRVLSLDPATVGAGIDASLSKFDAVWTSSLTWNNTDQPIATPLQTFQAGQLPLSAIVQQQATFNTGVLKPLPTGGVAGITLTTNYTFTNLPARINPSYQPILQFQFEQPLLQGFGVEINQLRASHPGSILTPGVFNQSPTPNGILITRLRFDQQRAEFERNLNQMLLNVETAYWNLYGSYWNLYSREQGLRFAYLAWRLTAAKFRAGTVGIGDLAQTRGQYELFRAQRLSAVDTLLDNERQLRALMGMSVDDGTRLMPADAPTLAPYQPDWHSALETALARRPELYMARLDVKANQLNLILAKNSLLPDLRLTATYDINGIGTTLSGPDPTNALRSFASNHFNDWAIGLRWNMPIGFRAAHANVRIAHLQLARSYAVLQDAELKAERFLGLEYRRITSSYEQIRAQRSQREALAQQLRAREEEFRAGRRTVDILLEAQRFWSDALANEYNAVVAYNNALCAFEYAKGTILQHNSIVVSEGPLPACAQVRAVEHERERTKALVLRERAAPTGPMAAPLPVQRPGVNYAPDYADPAMSQPSPSLPSLFKETPPLKDAKELPDPHRVNPAALDKAQGPVESRVDDFFPPPELPGGGTTSAAPTAAPTGKPSRPPAPKKKPSDFGALRPIDAAAPGTPPTAVPLPALPSAPALKP